MSWRTAAYRAVRPLLFLADPEFVHHLALRGLASAPGRALAPIASGVADSGAAPTTVASLRFRNRVGLAAGFDKDGVAIRGWAALGFGFVELGTVTPLPQAGNARPRLFRLPADEALINRMGFNNAGADALARRIVEARQRGLPDGFVIGVNIGRNRDGGVDDYPAAAAALAHVADYLAVNVSSPNTPGLRQLQEPGQLRAIVDAVAEAAPGPALLVKLSPDLSDLERGALLEALEGSTVRGIVASNTTVTRPVRSRRLAQEAGGLSGRPLLGATARAVRQLAGRRVAVVASGGVGSGADVCRLLEGGADLVQLWTGMIYRGPGLIGEAVAVSC